MQIRKVTHIQFPIHHPVHFRQCLDPVVSKFKCTGKCGAPKYKGDKVCDDANNNCGCNWDAGACCMANVNKKYCKVCKCLDPYKKPWKK